MFRHFYKTHVHILRGRNSISCTFMGGGGGERHRGDACTKGDKTFFMRKPCFICFNLCLVSCCLWCFELCLVSMLCCSNGIVLLCWTWIHPYAIVLYWMHVWMINFFSYDHCSHFHMIVLCLIKLLTVFTSCLLDRYLLVTLYLSFYHLIYLKGLMCFFPSVSGYRYIVLSSL